MEGMPKSAQYLPVHSELPGDAGVNLVIVQCSFCGVVQVTNPPVPYFREVIRASGISKEMCEYRQKQFSDFVSHYRLAGKRMLEIGCGAGEYLEILGQCGVRASGIEYGTSASKVASGKGLDVSSHFFETGMEVICGGPFDGFLFLNFLEHLPDPRSILAGIRRNLRGGGIGLVEVPNFELIVRDQMYSEFIADHLFYFSKDSLRKAIEINGFEVLECEETWHSYTLTAVVRMRQPLTAFKIQQYGEKLTVAFAEYIGRYADNQVAIWGAGHQAFTIMALADLGGKIKYVVDSAPFKQGKFTPTTHLPIVAPDQFFVDCPSAVVVIGGSYTKEIVSTIRNQIRTELDIAIVDGSSLVALEGLRELAE